MILGYTPLKTLDYNPVEDPNANSSQYGFIFYNTWPTIYNINKENIEYGSINVVETAIRNELVRVKISPKSGYELESIKIVDSENNIIEFQKIDKYEFEFLMPQSNVSIIPSYKKNSIIINPNTGNKMLLIMLILIPCIGIGIYTYKKKESK